MLIFESDAATLWLYTRALQPEYRVLAAERQEEVRSLLGSNRVQAVVMEPGPLDGGGWRLLADLRGRPELAAVPIILCSSLDERRRGQSLGASAYLVKPVLPADLLDSVRRFTNRRRTQGEPI